MTVRSCFVAALAVLCATTAPSPAVAQLGPTAAFVPLPSADLLLTNGKIYTPTGWVSAIAIARGVIVAMGDTAAVTKAAGPKTRWIDLKGQTVLPGLRDMHVHPLSAGIAEIQCKIVPGPMRQTLDATAACVRAKKPGEWVVGRAYEPAALGVAPTRQLLDAIAPDNPVILTDVSIHSSWANSAALKVAGITRDTPDPEGGVIERDARGEPTGVLRESAAVFVRDKAPPLTRAQTASALQWALDTIVANGIVGFDDALLKTDGAQAYADIADAGRLKPYVRGCIFSTEDSLIASRQSYARDRFSPSCVKMIIDGVPNDAHTAAMLEDYLPASGHAGGDAKRTRGMAFVQPEALAKAFIRYDAMGLTVKVHAVGDAAVRESIAAIEAARKANGYSGILHDIAHASVVAPGDFARARAAGAVIEFSPYIWSPSPIVDGVIGAIGAERMRRFIPIRDALDAGVFVVAGSDWNVVPTINPWSAMETMVTRRAPGGGGVPVAPAEAITLKQAVDIFTINAARQSYAGDRSGSIETGKRADLVVIDRNIFAVPITSVHDTRVQMTIINGEIVFEAPKRP